ncbi:hypothetical protein ACI782_16225 [Geodermatophilus sp. SYSU D00703]
MAMEEARNRFELRIGTLLSPAALATFRVPVRPSSVPRNTVRRLRVPADRDLTDVVHRLIERHVELLEIRRTPEPPRGGRRRPPGDERDVPGPADTGADVVPLRPARRRPRPSSPGEDTHPVLGQVPHDPAG